MDQQKLFTISLDAEYKYMEILENIFEEIAIATTISEKEITTNIDPLADDIWNICYYFNFKPEVAFIETKFINLPIKVNYIIEEVKNEDWVNSYYNNTKPVITNKFAIYNPNIKNYETNNLINIVISAANAFGTGDHPTTSGCIRLTEKLYDNNFKAANILDIGCGSGILSIISGKLWEDSIIEACDIEEAAMISSIKHAQINNVSAKFITKDGFNFLDKYPDNYADIIYANILMGPILELTEIISNKLKLGGYLIASGFIINQKDILETNWNKYNLYIHDLIIENDWVAALIIKL